MNRTLLVRVWAVAVSLERSNQAEQVEPRRLRFLEQDFEDMEIVGERALVLLEEELPANQSALRQYSIEQNIPGSTVGQVFPANEALGQRMGFRQVASV